MKFNCLKNELVQALSIVTKAIANKPQTPILSGIYLKAQGNTLELQATDHEMGIICTIASDIQDPGDIVLSGRYFQEVVRKLPGENVEVEFNRQENIIQIRSNNSKFTLLSMSVTDFPNVKHIGEGDHPVTVRVRDNILKGLIDKTAFACSADEARPVFTGCYFEIKESVISMAATNTHRLSAKSEALDNVEGNISCIIPARALYELSRNIVSDIPEDVEITCSKNAISFSFGNIFMTSRLIDGMFPDFRRVIPQDFQTRVTLSTADFLSAVERVSLIARSAEYNVVTLEFSGGFVRITSNNPDIGNADETVPALVDGPDVMISFNSKYVTEVLRSIGSENFYFSLNKSLEPAAVRDENDEGFIYIVTPVRTAAR